MEEDIPVPVVLQAEQRRRLTQFREVPGVRREGGGPREKEKEGQKKNGARAR